MSDRDRPADITDPHGGRPQISAHLAASLGPEFEQRLRALVERPLDAAGAVLQSTDRAAQAAFLLSVHVGLVRSAAPDDDFVRRIVESALRGWRAGATGDKVAAATTVDGLASLIDQNRRSKS